MTDNFEEFDQDQFEATDLRDEAAPEKKGGAKSILNKPIIKLTIIAGVVGLAVAGALGAFSGDKELAVSKSIQPPSIKEAPGGNVTPFFAEQNKLADAQRVEKAIAMQGSAMPTPIGRSVDPVDIDALSKKSQLDEFQAETERLRREWRAERQQNEQKIQVLQQQMSKRTEKPDDSLAKAMQKQLSDLSQSWEPVKLKVVKGVEPISTKSKAENIKGPASVQGAMVEPTPVSASSKAKEDKPILSAGTVNYAQLLTEANSDVPGPIMVQILSGPFSGGRAIGSFKVLYEQLVLSFNLVVHKNKEYRVDAIALNPDTTLSGLVTEVDHRYFKRVVLPAAAEFMSGFGDALKTAGSKTTVVGDSLVVSEVQKGYKEAAFDGMAKAGQSVSQFLQQEAQQTKTLVRVASGTAMGLFFLSSVKENGEAGTQEGSPDLEALARAYQQSGYGMPSSAMTSVPSVSAYPGAATRNDGSVQVQQQGAVSIVRTPGGVTVFK